MFHLADLLSRPCGHPPPATLMTDGHLSWPCQHPLHHGLNDTLPPLVTLSTPTPSHDLVDTCLSRPCPDLPLVTLRTWCTACPWSAALPALCLCPFCYSCQWFPELRQQQGRAEGWWQACRRSRKSTVHCPLLCQTRCSSEAQSAASSEGHIHQFTINRIYASSLKWTCRYCDNVFHMIPENTLPTSPHLFWSKLKFFRGPKIFDVI